MSHHPEPIVNPITGESTGEVPLRISMKDPRKSPAAHLGGRKSTLHPGTARSSMPLENEPDAPYRFSKHRRQLSEGDCIESDYDIDDNERDEDEDEGEAEF